LYKYIFRDSLQKYITVTLSVFFLSLDTERNHWWVWHSVACNNQHHAGGPHGDRGLKLPQTKKVGVVTVRHMKVSLNQWYIFNQHDTTKTASWVV